MIYLGIVKQQNGNLVTPDAFRKVSNREDYEAVQIGDVILLMPIPLNRERLKRIEELTKLSIEDHRKTLEELARLEELIYSLTCFLKSQPSSTDNTLLHLTKDSS